MHTYMYTDLFAAQHSVSHLTQLKLLAAADSLRSMRAVFVFKFVQIALHHILTDLLLTVMYKLRQNATAMVDLNTMCFVYDYDCNRPCMHTYDY